MISRTILVLSAALCCLEILLANLHLNFFNSDRSIYDRLSNNVNFWLTEQPKGKMKSSDRCILSTVDPWDPVVAKHLNPWNNPLKKCKRPKMQTYLVDGHLRLFDNSTSNCSYRCLISTGEKTSRGELWIKMKRSESYRVVCDFVEIYCMRQYVTTFRYIHTQANYFRTSRNLYFLYRPKTLFTIRRGTSRGTEDLKNFLDILQQLFHYLQHPQQVVRSKSKNFQKEDELHPSVVILLFDSTSSSSGLRSMMETAQLLQQYYDATIFYHHNKVGINSRPNAFAMFSGARISKLDPKQFLGRDEPDFQDSCTLGLKRNETVTYDFHDQGYALFDAEDWIGAFTYPNCNGYGNDIPFDHYSGAYTSRLSNKAVKKEFNKFYGCQKRHFQLMEYFDQFLTEYEGVAKFAMIWLSWISHDTINGLYHVDKFFANFFRKQVERLRNSFIFLMGDHGMRFGPIRSSSVGLFEDNNPLLMVAVPEHLRSNVELIANLQLNARRHTSQYDIYATLYDIARVAKRQNFTTWDEFDFRTCAEIEIAEEYCICSRNWSIIRTDLLRVQEAATVIITFINDYLKQKNVSKLCATLQLKKVKKAEILEDNSELRLSIEADPGGGQFVAQLKMVDGNYELATKVHRTNAYHKQGNCVQHEDIRPLCLCIHQQSNEMKKKMKKKKNKWKKWLH